MKKTLLFLASVIIALSFVLTACDDNTKPVEKDVIETADVTKLGEGEKKFIFSVITADGEESVFEISTDKETVGDALSEHKLIDGEEGQYGLYVKTVNSVTYDFNKGGKYWAFYINGEYATSGVDKTAITEGDTYMFKAE